MLSPRDLSVSFLPGRSHSDTLVENMEKGNITWNYSFFILKLCEEYSKESSNTISPDTKGKNGKEVFLKKKKRKKIPLQIMVGSTD